jgi:hypothetical protein
VQLLPQKWGCFKLGNRTFAGVVRRFDGMPSEKNILKIPKRIPSNANHGPGLCTPTFAQHKSPTCRHNMPYMENMESRESSSDPATVVLNIFFELKKWSRGGNLGHVQVTWLIFQAFQDLTITHYWLKWFFLAGISSGLVFPSYVDKLADFICIQLYP